MSDTFAVTSREEAGVQVVTVCGDVDLATVPQLKQALTDAEAAGERLVLDLSAVTFMDSTGLGVLISAQNRAGRANRKLIVVLGDSRVMRTFSVTGLDSVFETLPDTSAALGALSR